jgi:hypothetical protein
MPKPACLFVVIVIVAHNVCFSSSPFRRRIQPAPMSQDTPSLALSDIMHTMSPSPAPQDPVVQLRPKSTTPEPVQEDDVQRIRSRVAEMGLTGGDQDNASAREKELVDMVCQLRLRGSAHIDCGTGASVNKLDTARLGATAQASRNDRRAY